MSRTLSDRIAELVTNHNRIVLLLTLLLTAGVVDGVTHLELQGSSQVDSDAFGDTEVAQKSDYMNDHYGEDDADNATRAPVYVRAEDGNALSKASLLRSQRYQQTVRNNESVAAAFVDEAFVPAVVTTIPDATAFLNNISDSCQSDFGSRLDGASCSPESHSTAQHVVRTS